MSTRRGKWAIAFALVAAGAAQAAVASWSFDVPSGATTGAVLAGVGDHALDLLLGPAGQSVPGRSGQGLRPSLGRPPTATEIVAGLDVPSPVARRNPLDSALNLGAGDWTFECWLRLDAAAAAEGVIFEIGSGKRGATELFTRLSVAPGEELFLLTGLVRPPPGGTVAMGRTVEYAAPDGPPQGAAVLLGTALALAPGTLRREQWLHVAVVHRAEARLLRLHLNGKLAAVTRAEPLALPRSDFAYVALGQDGMGSRRLRGIIDELKFADHVVYTAEFAPPAIPAPRGGVRSAR